MRRRTFQLGFAARLVFAIVVTFVLAGAAGYGLMGRQIERRIMAAHVSEQRADAASFVAIGQRSESRDEIVTEIDEVLRAIHRRPGVLETLLIDERGVVARRPVDDDVVGERGLATRGSTPRCATGARYAGREADAERDVSDFEFVAPVELAGRRLRLRGQLRPHRARRRAGRHAAAGC